MKKNRIVICDREFVDSCLWPIPYDRPRTTLCSIDGTDRSDNTSTLSYGKYYEPRTLVCGLAMDEQDEEIVLLYCKLIDAITNLNDALKKRRKIKALSKQRYETERTAKIFVTYVISYLLPVARVHDGPVTIKEWLEAWIPAIDGLTENLMALLPR